MQEEERRLTLKPESGDLALMAKKKFFKAKGNLSQKTEEIQIKDRIKLKVCMRIETNL